MSSGWVWQWAPHLLTNWYRRRFLSSRVTRRMLHRWLIRFRWAFPAKYTFENSNITLDPWCLLQDISQVIGFYYRRIYLIPKQIRLLCVYLMGYIIVIILFVAFIRLNGSIVVGDKSAHEAAVHIPQVMLIELPRFLAEFLFYNSFSTAILLHTIRSGVRSIRRDHTFVVDNTIAGHQVVCGCASHHCCRRSCLLQHTSPSVPAGR